MESTTCVAVLGGSFDPVHNGHVALADYFTKLLFPDVLRIIPAGNPWQKQGLQAAPAQRVDMLRLAFARSAVPVVIDEQELRRTGVTYTIDTLRALRAELGPETSIAFLLGADQLQQLHTWKDWRTLFSLAHLCAASRPGFDTAQLDADVAHEFARRAATPQQVRETPHGLAYVAGQLAVDVSATQIRHTLERSSPANSLIAPGVLDYIKQHHLYESRSSPNGH